MLKGFIGKEKVYRENLELAALLRRQDQDIELLETKFQIWMSQKNAEVEMWKERGTRLSGLNEELRETVKEFYKITLENMSMKAL